jgi:hypothetical protein
MLGQRIRCNKEREKRTRKVTTLYSKSILIVIEALSSFVIFHLKLIRFPNSLSKSIPPIPSVEFKFLHPTSSHLHPSGIYEYGKTSTSPSQPNLCSHSSVHRSASNVLNNQYRVETYYRHAQDPDSKRDRDDLVRVV